MVCNYERIQGNDIYNVAPNPPFVSTATIFNTNLSKPWRRWRGNPGLPTLTVYDPKYPVPQVQQYNLGRSTRGYRAASLPLSGTSVPKGTFLSDTRNINQPFPDQAAKVVAGTLNVNQARPYPGYGNINVLLQRDRTRITIRCKPVCERSNITA